jgi:hypothetical protein
MQYNFEIIIISFPCYADQMLISILYLVKLIRVLLIKVNNIPCNNSNKIQAREDPRTG